MRNKIIAALLSLMLVLSISGCALSENAHSSPSSPMSETPSAAPSVKQSPSASPSPVATLRPEVSEDIKAQDECILAYFEALKENDADKIIRISPSSMTGKIYGDMLGSGFIGDLYSMSQTTDLMERTSNFIYSILSYTDPKQRNNKYTREQIDQFIRDVNPTRLGELNVLKFGTPVEPPKIEIPEGLQADTNIFSFRECLFSMGEDTYHQVFWLVRTDDGYRLGMMGAQGSAYSGIASPVTAQEFDTLIDPQTVNEAVDMLHPDFGPEEKTYLQKIKDINVPTFSSEKAVIDFFASSAANKDAFAMISAFNVKEKADSLDVYLMAEYMGFFVPYNYEAMTSEYAFYRDINLAVNCGKRAANMLLMLAAFSYDYPRLLESEFSVDMVFSALQETCDNISTLSIIRSDVLGASKTENGNITNSRIARTYGGGDMEQRIVEYSLCGKMFTGGMQLISYGKYWRLHENTTVLLALPAQIPVLPSSELDYDSYI